MIQSVAFTVDGGMDAAAVLDAEVGGSTVVVGMFEGVGAGRWVVVGAALGCATALAVGLIVAVAGPLHAASDSRNGSIKLA